MMVNTEVSSQLEKDFSKVIKIDSSEVHAHIDSMVRETVEETLNKMLEAEADRLCNAERYEHSDEQSDARAGHYNRKLHVKAGVVNLKVPRLRKTTFETAIIERYRRREVAGVSVRRVEDITEALWGTRVSPGAVSDLNKKLDERIELWRNRNIAEGYPNPRLQTPNRVLEKLAKSKLPTSGKPCGWAAGIVYAISSIGVGVPGVLNSELEQCFGRSMSTVY